MNKVVELKKEIKISMVDKNKDKLTALRMLLSSLENQKIVSKLEEVEDLPDDSFVDVVMKELKMLKQERESIVNAGRDTDKVDYQIEVVEYFAPVFMDEEEIKSFLEDKIEVLGVTNKKEIGKVMGVVGKELKGKADLGLVSKILRGMLD